MKKILSLIFAIAVLFLLSGCAGTRVRSDVTETEISKKSVAILSISHDIEAGNGANAIFYLDLQKSSIQGVLMSVQDTLSITKDSDFTTRRGHLYILELEPGMHDISSWQVYSAGVRIYPKGKLPPLKFEIKEGEVLYLGNVHARLMLAHKLWFGNGIAARGAMPFIGDQSAEDIPMAETQVPALRGRIKTSLLPQGPWVASEATVNQNEPLFVPNIPVKK
ncbi:hypothetical protein DXT88_07960 [Herbaspirillum lusitanum]|uniref:hypothetical protein n=1 Tax=Herbaspirillum lusitanum TaxID=213312 RepID=UPI0022377674|nr:hypothetical protein [Herbaspirillum lusitanum]MCW5298111.1 hypothetical protein [Herbaspirillum lusitanum]